MNVTALPPSWPPPVPCPICASGRARLTPELSQALVQQVERGLPLTVICAAPGWPARQTVRVWRNRHPDFDQAMTDAQARGGQRIADMVLGEVVERHRRAGRYAARRLLDARHSQLAATHRETFAGGKWSLSTEKMLGIKRPN